MGLNASCFFWCIKNNCQSYHPAYHSPVSFSHTHWHRHRKRWASITDVGPAINQHWFNASCLLCLAIIGLEHCWASVNVRQWLDSDGCLYTPNQVPAYIAYLVSRLSAMLGQRRRRLANIDLLLFPNFINRLSKKKT